MIWWHLKELLDIYKLKWLVFEVNIECKQSDSK